MRHELKINNLHPYRQFRLDKIFKTITKNWQQQKILFKKQEDYFLDIKSFTRDIKELVKQNKIEMKYLRQRGQRICIRKKQTIN